MILDAVGYSIPEPLQALLSCRSNAERELVAAARFGDKTLDEIYRQFELDQFYEYCGKSATESTFSSESAWRITAIKWPVSDYAGGGGIEFDFTYAKIPQPQPSRCSVTGFSMPYMTYSYGDTQGYGSVTVYPGEYDDRIRNVLRNFAESYMTCEFFSKDRSLHIEKFVSQLLRRVKSYVCPETGYEPAEGEGK